MNRSPSNQGIISTLSSLNDQRSELTTAEKEQLYSRRRYRDDPSRAKRYTANYAKGHRRERYCNLLVHLAVKSGKLIKQPCEVCGAAKADAHHDDYTQPLSVRWLCRSHHRKLHYTRKAA